MVRKFEVGGVYNAFAGGLRIRNAGVTPGWHEPAKVTRISAHTVLFRRTCSIHTHRAKIQKEYTDEHAFLRQKV